MIKKQKILSVLTVLSMLAVNHAVYAKGGISVIYVSPDGNDLAYGTEYDPLKTLEGARNKIRELKTDSKLSDKGITVLFREGEYSWQEQVNFTDVDSGTADCPVVYSSYPGEKVSFTGGVKTDDFENIADETVIERLAENALNVKQIDLNRIFGENGYSIVSDSNVFSFGEEQEMWPARFPNKTGGAYEEINPLTVFWKTTVNDGMEVNQFSYSGLDSDIKEKIDRYAANDDVRIYGNLVYGFWDNDYPVSIDTQNEIITVKDIADTFDTENEQRIRNNMPFFLYNILEELDRQGEYYIKDGIMYVYRDSFENTTMNIAMYDKDYMISTKNASYITFRGITFENTRGTAAYVQGGENVCFDRCSFKNIGKSAVIIGKSLGNFFHRIAADKTNYTEWSQERYELFCGEDYSVDVTGKNHGLNGCIIRNTGEAAVKLSGGNVYRDEECGYYVKNCIIEFAGLHERTYTGAININYSYGLYLENNTLAHIPGAIINGSAYKMLLKNNDIFDGMTESYDNALVYLNYQSPVLDIKFDGNYFHDVRSDVPLTRNRLWPGPQVGAVAFDNSPMGGGYEYTNNVFENLPYGIWYVNGTRAENNVFLNCYNPIKGGGGKLEQNDPESNKPLRASWSGIFENRETGFRDGLTLEEKRIMYLTAAQAKEENLTTDPAYINRAQLTCYENVLSLPVFIGENDTERQVRACWYEKYPSFMQWLDITEAGATGDKGFMTVKNNLIINEGGGTEAEPSKNDLAYYHYKPEEFSESVLQSVTLNDKTFSYEITDNVYTQERDELTGSIYSSTVDSVGTSGIVGADEYSESIQRLPEDEYTGILNAVGYRGTKIVNISGKDAMLTLCDNVSMILMDEQNNIIHADQTYAAEDGNYNFRFETDRDNFDDCSLKIHVAGRLLTDYTIIMTSDMYDVIRPEFSATKNSDDITLRMSVENAYLVPDYKYSFIVAGYDNNGKLCGLKTDKDKYILQGGLTEDSYVVKFTDFTQAEFENISLIKAYLWNGVSEMRPLADYKIIKIKE
ncbi:MAG: right-handed parallel beta-helix repeat-containing protein [Clostridia bacterium]|nr:right-handed parallel beta-helix repeat-containing protein [Clostridia bacterium]